MSDWKRIQLVITSTSFYRRIWRLVYTCDANANANANGNASESTRPKQTRGKRDTQAQWKHFYKMADNDWAFTDSHVWVGNANASSRKWKFVYYLRWRLRLHLHLRWVGSHEQLFLSFAVIFKAGFIPQLFELSCMSKRPLTKLCFLLTTNYRSKTMILKFAFNNCFSSFDVKKFPRPLYRCVLLRLAENKREKSLKEAKNLAIATTYKLGALSFKKADWFKWGISCKAINVRVL